MDSIEPVGEKQSVEEPAVSHASHAEQPAPTADNAQGLYEGLEPRINRDNDEYVNSGEVDEAIKDPEIKGDQAALLVALKKHGSEISGLSNDQWGGENGISKKDMGVLHEMQNNVRASAYAQSEFDGLDGDRNKHLPREELQTRLDGADNETERKRLQTLLDAHGHISGRSNDEWGRETSGISRDDLSAWDKDNHRDMVADIDGRMAWTRQEMKQANRSLYATPDDPTASIKPDAIRQGDINDCYFLSSLSSLAERDPKAIQNMISDNQNGSYTVTFPGDTKNPVTVGAPTDAQLMTYNHGSERGTWASVMESAYNKYSNDHVNTFRKSSDLEGGGSGRHPLTNNHALGPLTGRSVDQDLLNFTTDATLHNKMSGAERDGRPATAWIMGNAMLPTKAPNESGLPTGHEYGILGYDAESRTVTVRNPYGRNPLTVGEPLNAEGGARDGEADGVFRMTLDQFRRNFDGVAYAR
ncbi:MAG: hypothetical protein FJX76_06085 [Armatimonadetes bacterium]|nr:hypothetical protein [Armatimonadota bacterium]